MSTLYYYSVVIMSTIYMAGESGSIFIYTAWPCGLADLLNYESGQVQ